jgi:pimeloyl-ACP methyl ester carboxylesterase
MAAAGVERIEIEGRGFAWRRLGVGSPLLLINGYAATGADWDPAFLAGLAESFSVISPDNRGLGESELGGAELTIDGMAADLEALLDALGIDRATVVGWSMGGFVAQRLVVRAPARVAALALLATDPGGPDSVPAAVADWSRLTDHAGTPREQATRLISLLFPPELAVDIDREFGEVVAAAQARLSPRALRVQEAAMDAWHRDAGADPAPAETPPTLIVHGDLDVVIPAANAEALVARWPGARVELLTGCAHAVMAQGSRRVVELVGALGGH